MAQIPPKIKKKSHIVFCLDRSFSMKPFMEVLKEHLLEFFNFLEKEANADVEIGIIAQSRLEFLIKNFTKDIDSLKEFLEMVSAKGNEFTLPAIDISLDMFSDIQEKSHKIIVVITDEPLSQGYLPDFQRSKIEELVSKIKLSNIYLFYFGRDCPEYRYLFEKQLSKSYFNAVNFFQIKEKKIELIKILDIIKSSLYLSITASQNVQCNILKKNIYELPKDGYPKIIYL